MFYPGVAPYSKCKLNHAAISDKQGIHITVLHIWINGSGTVAGPTCRDSSETASEAGFRLSETNGLKNCSFADGFALNVDR